MLAYLFVLFVLVAVVVLFLTRNIVYLIFWSTAVFLSIAALYVLLGADFLAISQLLIYVGGILILLMFGLMLSYSSREVMQKNLPPSSRPQSVFSSLILASTLFLLLGQAILSQADKHTSNRIDTPRATTIYSIGRQFLTTHWVAFEAVALALLIALLGAILIAAEKKEF